MCHSIAELAADAFAKHERCRMLAIMNTPVDYEERKKAFVEMAEAQAAAIRAQAALDDAIRSG